MVLVLRQHVLGQPKAPCLASGAQSYLTHLLAHNWYVKGPPPHIIQYTTFLESTTHAQKQKNTTDDFCDPMLNCFGWSRVQSCIRVPTPQSISTRKKSGIDAPPPVASRQE